MKILNRNNTTIDECINETAKVITDGGLVIVPTDTVYGVSVDARNPFAVKKLLEFKSRPVGKAISVFVENLKEAEKYVEISPSQNKLLDNILPGSYTVVLKSKGVLDPMLEAEDTTLGIRVIDTEFISGLLARCGHPVTATSANIAGRSPHYSVESLLNSLSESKKQMIDLIIDEGKLPIRKPSTVMRLVDEEMKVLRPGSGDAQKYSSTSPEETQKIAKEFMSTLVQSPIHDKPVVILLFGEMGAGKTVFVKALAEELGIEKVVSPTFVISNEYPIVDDEGFGRFTQFVHADLFRITDENEFKNLGFEEYMKPGVLMCIEWSEKAEALIQMFSEKADIHTVAIDYSSAQAIGSITSRTIEII